MSNLSAQEVNSIAQVLSARRELAVDSVDLLLTALKLNDVTGIQIALRSLGVTAQDDIAYQISELTSSLHSLVEDFRNAMIESPNEGLGGAIRKLNNVIQMNFDAAEKTLARCENQAFHIRNQKNEINALEQSFIGSGIDIPEPVAKYLEQMRTNLDKMQQENHQTIMAQTFHDLSRTSVTKVISLMENIQKQIYSLTIACTEDDGIKEMVSAVRTRRRNQGE